MRKVTSPLNNASRGRRLFASTALLVAWVWLALGLAQVARAAIAFPPELGDAGDQVKFLRFIQKHIPRLFEEGAEYDVDLFGVLTKEQELVAQLKAQPGYMNAAKGKAGLRKVRIDVHQPQSALERRPKPDSLEAWKNAYVADGERDRNEARNNAKALELIRALSARDPRGIITGLINCLPKEARSELFALPAREQLARLQTDDRLNDETVTAGFKGLPDIPKGISAKAYLLEQLESGLAQESELVYRLALSRARKLGVAEGPADTLFSRAAEKQLDLGDGLADWDALAREADPARGPAYLRKLVQSAMKSLYAAQPTVRDTVIESLELVEVPPYIGTFRGFAGGDCATQVAFPFSYAPAESTYFIYDSRGELKGYAMTTNIRAEGKPAVYIHDIAGPRLSPRMMEIAIYGLSKLAKQDGARAMLPDFNRIFLNSNYLDQRTTQQRLIAQPSVALEYTDAPERQLVAPFAQNANYDLPNQNLQGHFLAENKALEGSLRLEIQPLAPPKPALEPLDHTEAVFLALDFLAGKRSRAAAEALDEAIAAAAAGNLANAQAVPDPNAPVQPAVVADFSARETAAATVLAQAGVDPEKFNALEALLPNPTKLALAEYYQHVQARFEALGVAFDAKLAGSRPYYFYEGHLSAPDATSTDNRDWAKQSVDFAVALLKRWPNPAAALEAIQKNPAMFSQSLKFQNYLVSLLNPEEQDLARLDKLISMGVDTRALAGMGETLETISKKASPGIRPVLARLKQAITAADSRASAEADDEGCEGRLVAP